MAESLQMYIDSATNKNLLTAESHKIVYVTLFHKHKNLTVNPIVKRFGVNKGQNTEGCVNHAILLHNCVTFQ